MNNQFECIKGEFLYRNSLALALLLPFSLIVEIGTLYNASKCNVVLGFIPFAATVDRAYFVKAMEYQSFLPSRNSSAAVVTLSNQRN